MSEDIIETLRRFARNAQEQNATDAVVGLLSAADEIERLRADLCTAWEQAERWRDERDEARREVCKLTGGWITRYGQEPQRLAAERGWDCFKEDSK